jgi:Phycobilisome degradation protein nblA
MSNLSLEQQFKLRTFVSEVEKMSHAQAQEFVIKLYEQMLIQDNFYHALLKKEWGIDSMECNRHV